MASTAALVRRVTGCVAVLTLGLAGVSAVSVSTVGAAVPTKADVHFERLAGFSSPGTPAKYNKVGILETGPRSAKNILVLVPGTSASAAYFEPLAKDIVAKTPGWQVWAVERRENLLEDQSVLDQAKAGKASAQKLFDYYLGFTTDPSVKDHFKFLKDDDVAFGRDWGMKVEIEDLRRVVQKAAKHGDKVVLGGHSLGGSIVTAYATWDFGGHAGADDLDGLVYIDGGSSPTPDTPEVATTELQQLKSGSPWLTFGGIPAPYAGLFNSVASTLVHNEPDAPALLSTWPRCPRSSRLRSRQRTWVATDTRSTRRHRPRRCGPRRHTSASSPQRVTRAAGIRPARSRRSSAMPTCSPAPDSRVSTGPRGTTRNG